MDEVEIRAEKPSSFDSRQLIGKATGVLNSVSKSKAFFVYFQK